MTWALDLARHYKGAEGVANIFGIVLYTDAHANLKKALRDEDYWKALDEVSGSKWPVFSIRAIGGRYETPSPPPVVAAFMVPIWKEPAANKQLLEVFELDSTKNLPVLVVFTLDDQEQLYRTVVKLEDESPESAFKSLKEVLRAVADAVGGVAPENLPHGPGVMAAVNLRLEDLGSRARLKKAYSLLKELKSWLP